MPHTADISEAQSLADNDGGNKNHFLRQRTNDTVKNPSVIVNLAYSAVSNVNEPEYYTYDRYARLVKM